MRPKFTSTIAGASIYISIILLLSKGFGFFREIIFAGYFGTGEQYDLYLVGAVIPVTINIIIFFLGQNFFIPAYKKNVVSDLKIAVEFSTDILVKFFLGGIILAGLMLIFSNLIVKLYLPSSTKEIQETAKTVFRIFLITIPLSACIAILSSYLQAKLEFKYPALSQLFLNASIILLVVMFTNQLGIYAIAIGYTIGTLFQLIYLFNKALKIGELKFDTSIFGNIKLRNFLTSSLIMIVLIESIGQLYMVVDRLFYKNVEVGGIAALNYAQSLFIFPITIFSFALSSAIFPRISDAYHRKSFLELNSIINDSIRVSILLFLPISLIFIIYGHSIIHIIYERGRFTSAGTKMTFELLRILSFSLVFYSVYSILNKMFYSAGFLRALLAITISGIFIKLLLNIILVPSFSQNGLALSTTLSYFSFFLISILYLNKKLNLSSNYSFLFELVFSLINGFFCFLITGIISELYSIGIDKREVFSVLIFSTIYLIDLILIKHSALDIIKRLSDRFIPILSNS